MPHTDDLLYLRKLAQAVEHKLSTELSLKCIVGIGTPARHVRELADRYKEAVMSIEVGKIFDIGNAIISYERLGLGRLIYQIPTTLCEMFLSEVLKKGPIEALDKETLATIDSFFENSLNVSETARKLFVHRNTLVYRLEKIKRITGLDLREFEHAIVFKVALMVKKYLFSQETKY
jgi:carbohydrate diacid regulator